MKIKVIISISLLLGFSTSLFSHDPREISDKASKTIEFESMEMVATLNIFDNRGNVRTRQIAIATKKFSETTKTLMRFLSPPDVSGTSILIFDYENKADDMWIYLPSLRRTRRIVSTEKGKSFMGSEFSNANMSRPNIDDFTYKLLGSETVNDKECWKIEATCKSKEVEDENGFQKRVSFIEKETYLSQKSELYDRNGRLMKIMTLSDYRKQPNGKYFAFSMIMENVQNNRRSEMKVDKFQLGTNLNEDSFSTTSMEK